MRRTAQRTAPPPDLPPSDESVPFALTEETQRGLLLTALSAGALRSGLSPGLSLADARARAPQLLVCPAEPQKDADALERLAYWSMRFSPFIAVDAPDGLLLDITGTAHLFGGEAQFIRLLIDAYARLGLTAKIALAPTIGAAWALARYGPEAPDQRLIHEDCLRTSLAPLPVAALRIDAAAQTVLSRFGLKRIDSLYGLPRASLARRFRSSEKSAAVVMRLDEALGHLSEPLTPLTPPASTRVRLTIPEPLQTVPALMIGLERLAEALAKQLAREHEGARRLCLSLYRVDGEVTRRHIGLSSPSRDAAHFIHLFKDRLEGIDAGFGIDLMTLEAETRDHLAPGQTSLAKPGTLEAGLPERLHVLIDRLSGRFGEDAVTRPGLQASHLPEQAGPPVNAAVKAAAPSDSEAAPTLAPRPFRLLERPEPIAVVAEVPDGPPLTFTWRRLSRRARRARGPERIASEWWQNLESEAPIRDYYEIEDEAGRRYWVFREGLFQDAGTSGPPQWYVHGFFC